MSPLYILYGHEYIFLKNPNFKIESLNQMIQEMHRVMGCAEQCMQGAQEKFKFYAD